MYKDYDKNVLVLSYCFN